MSKYTPGPWHESFVSDKTWHKGVYDVGENEVAIVKVKSALIAPRRDADARLIAAAPDLLAALRAWTMAANGDGIDKHNLITLVKLSESAIDKATAEKGGRT